MPRWCKRNVIGWVRRLGSDWDVRCIDIVDGSPNNALNFISAEYLPDCFLKKAMSGKSFAQHASDMVRLPLVYLVSLQAWSKKAGQEANPEQARRHVVLQPNSRRS